MAEFFDKWTPGQFTLLVMTVGIAVTLVVFILSITHYQMRALADGTALERERLAAGQALRQDLLRRNLPPADLKLTLAALGLEAGGAAPAGWDGDQSAAVLKGLLACSSGVPAADVEETVALAAGANPAVQRALSAMLADAAENGYDGEQVFATVRAVCKAGVKAAEPARAEPAAGSKPDLDLRFDRELVTS